MDPAKGRRKNRKWYKPNDDVVLARRTSNKRNNPTVIAMNDLSASSRQDTTNERGNYSLNQLHPVEIDAGFNRNSPPSSPSKTGKTSWTNTSVGNGESASKPVSPTESTLSVHQQHPRPHLSSVSSEVRDSSWCCELQFDEKEANQHASKASAANKKKIYFNDHYKQLNKKRRSKLNGSGENVGKSSRTLRLFLCMVILLGGMSYMVTHSAVWNSTSVDVSKKHMLRMLNKYKNSLMDNFSNFGNSSSFSELDAQHNMLINEETSEHDLRDIALLAALINELINSNSFPSYRQYLNEASEFAAGSIHVERPLPNLNPFSLDVASSLVLFPASNRRILYHRFMAGDMAQLTSCLSQQSCVKLLKLAVKAVLKDLEHNHAVSAATLDDLHTTFGANQVAAQVGVVLPSLLVQLVLLQASVRHIDNFSAPGLRVVYQRKGHNSLQSLYYVGVEEAGYASLLRFLTPIAPFSTLLKTTDYVLRRKELAPMKATLLLKTRLLVQDDSGIPLKYLQGRFDWQLFGDYRGPSHAIAVAIANKRSSLSLSDVAQEELLDAYRGGHHPVAFQFGYPFHTALSTVEQSQQQELSRRKAWAGANLLVAEQQSVV